MIAEDREDRWVAALCHASVAVFMMGAIVPLVVWITQKDRSKILRFQALQGLVYQMAGTLAYFLIMGVMFFLWFGMMAAMVLGGFVATSGAGGSQDISPLAGLAFLVVFGLMMLFQFGLLLVGPVYILLGLWGGFRILRGADFHYPLLGRFIERRLESTSAAAGQG